MTEQFNEFTLIMHNTNSPESSVRHALNLDARNLDLRQIRRFIFREKTKSYTVLAHIKGLYGTTTCIAKNKENISCLYIYLTDSVLYLFVKLCMANNMNKLFFLQVLDLVLISSCQNWG